MSEQADKIKRIRVDRDLCISAAACVALAAGVFALDDENIAVTKIKNGEATSDEVSIDDLAIDDIDKEEILEAAQACPTLAIILEDGDGNQVFPKEGQKVKESKGQRDK
jgi:ferredoxin